MYKTIVVYGLFLGFLVVALQSIEYFFLVRTHIFEIYGGLIALIFLAIGLWFGRKNQPTQIENVNFECSDTDYSEFGISKREYEVLVLLAKGFSNQAIADELFVSRNTIKTHTSRLFEKLEVKNRTQILIKAKEKGLIS
jgi:two-component system, NarL family, response regulator LiaR